MMKWTGRVSFLDAVEMFADWVQVNSIQLYRHVFALLTKVLCSMSRKMLLVDLFVGLDARRK